MPKVRLAVAGAGMIGVRHIEETRRSRGAVLAAIVDPAPKAADLARDAGVPLYPSLAELFAHDRPDGVVLATPNQLHVEQGLQCVAAGIPTLIEKPVAHDYAEGVHLCEAAEKAGVPLLVGHHRIHSPILHKAVEIVRSGALGTIVAVVGTAVFYKPDAYYQPPNDWRRRPGGGPILLNMIHEVGNLRAMIGEIAAVQAFASSATRGYEVEDTVAMTFRFANGALGTFLLSDTAASPKSWEQTSQEAKVFPSYDEDAYTLLGTMGSLGVPTMRLRTYPSAEERSWFKPFRTEVIPLERADPLANQIEHFAAVIRGEAKPLVTARDGLQNLRVTDAILEAARTGRIVETLQRHGTPA
jgi:predicted dehydrogenase